jgi:DNA-binding GntR family transcriptional regulator
MIYDRESLERQAGAMSVPDVEEFARETSPDAVARYLRALIVRGELRRGDRVPRDDIARALGVSPIPVREAIIALDREGWLVIEPHRGAFVHGVDEAWVADHYDLMGSLFALIVARASKRATDDELAELAALGKRLARERDVDAFNVVNERITRRLIELARSPRLAAALRGVPNLVPGNFFAEVPGTTEPQRRAIPKIVRAVVARAADAAAASMRALPSTTGAAVVALLRTRRVIDPDDA